MGAPDHSPRFRGVQRGCTLSGVFAMAAQVTDAIIVIHGPVGCAHINMVSDMSRCLSLGSLKEACLGRVVCSALGEMDAVYGAEGALGRSLDHGRRSFPGRPALIINTCVVDVIGDDVREQATRLAQGMDVVVLPSGGFLGGEFDQGLVGAAMTLLDAFVPPDPAPPEAGKVALVCEKTLSTAVEVNFAEVARLLSCLSMEVGVRFVRRTTTESMARLPRMEAFLPRADDETMAVAREAARRFDRPCLTRGFPVGLGDTRRWLEEVGALTGREGLAREAAREQEAVLARALAHRPLEGCRVAIHTTPRDLTWLFEALMTGGATVEAVLVLPTGVFRPGAELDGVPPGVPVWEDVPLGQALDRMRRLGADLCLLPYGLPEEVPGLVVRTIPSVPLVGPMGLARMVEGWARALRVGGGPGWRSGVAGPSRVNSHKIRKDS